ncbi:MAG: DUF1553 domain-containing protein [Planctomycetota bacterium]|nr:DUF1553 domain-containing protein [Planctomycetota bacterium]
MIRFESLFQIAFLVGCCAAGIECSADDRPVTFEVDVRPIFKTHCFQCHGEAGEKKGGLDLRLRRLVVAGGESGPAIDPSKPSNSRLLERVRNGEMPPGKKRLSNAEIAKIEAWITAGAKTARAEPESIDGPLFTEEERGWWSFQPVVRPAIPPLQHESIRTPIDAFILARLRRAAKSDASRRAEYRLAPVATRETLIRRASFGLLGLPPTPDRVTEFAADSSPDAWSKLVDRLLASPNYGERWGRHWLDVAGYADSEGYTDEDRVRDHAYRFRDYVIRAFNADLPFDRFIVEQLAGDELAGSISAGLTPESIELLTAVGFLRLAPDGTASSGIDQSLARNQVVADTLQIVGTSLLGMTIHCAQCHDHRYDPISQVDYYRMRAIFEPALDWKNWKTPVGRQISLYSATDRKLRSEIEAEAKQADAKRQQRVDYYITKTLEQELLLVDDEIRDALRTAYRTDSAKRSADQTKLLNDHPSIARLSAGALYLYDRRREARAKDIETRRSEKERRFIAAARQRELAKLPDDVRSKVEAAIASVANQQTDQQRQLLKTHANVIVTAVSLAQVNPEATAELAVYTKAAAEIRKDRIANELKKYADESAAIRAKIPKEKFIRTLMETPGKVPDTFLFFRGDHEQPKQSLEPASLSVLDLAPAIPRNDPKLKTSGRRLQFARYLTDGRHPLVARVLVNRVWMHHFGRGLVNSPGDFGVLGEKPTHPKLLDWLAAEFVDAGWSIKHLHRLILSSTVYQQSAIGSEAMLVADPDNRLYGRMSIRRLEGEILRDAVLSVSDKLNSKLYGEPVPVMEDAVGRIILGKENLDGERKPTKPIPLLGEEFRRSLYIQVRRTRPLGVLETFDSPVVAPNCVKRNSSNVAPQSLLMMNSDFALSYADRFAERLIANAGDSVRQQIELGWRLAYGVIPSDDEVSAAEGFVDLQRTVVLDSSSKPQPTVAQQQALASFCQALLSSSRFLYIE